MNNYSNSSDAQPQHSIQAKIWQFAGLILISGGLLVMAWAGWTYYQQQAELTNPPAPIVDSSAIEPLDTPTPRPQPTETSPPAIAQNNANDAKPVDSASSPTPRLDPTKATPTPTPEMLPVEATDVISPVETAMALDANAEDVPSLADNPLPVPEESDETNEPIEPPARDSASFPTRIVAPSINLDTSIIETGWTQVERDGVMTNVWIVADYAAGWHNNSALPGEGGNIVLSGHHNINGEVFRDIVELEVGETVTVFMDDQPYDYVVNDKFIVKDKGEPDSVRRANAKWIGPFNEERLTLVTCWPYNNNTHRVIVIAKPL